MLHVNNHYDARDKLGNLKVHFNGPKINCFEESLYTNTEKIVRPRKEYKNEIILHQGKASEHLER